MKQAKAHLQIHIHKVNGSTTTFVQDDPGEIRKIFDGFLPTQIFNRDVIAFTDKNSITSLPASQITRIDLISEQLPNLNFPVGMVEAMEVNPERRTIATNLGHHFSLKVNNYISNENKMNMREQNENETKAKSKP